MLFTLIYDAVWYKVIAGRLSCGSNLHRTLYQRLLDHLLGSGSSYRVRDVQVLPHLKTAYHLAMDIKRRSVALRTGSSSSIVPRNWNFVWSLKIPGKIRHFLWRFLHEILPVNCELVRRHIVVNGTSCFLCNQDSETAIHVMRDCPFARQVWALSHILAQVVYDNSSTIWDWVTGIRIRLDGQDFMRFIVLCWNIWYTRNKVRFENIQSDPMIVVQFVNWFLEFQESVLCQRPLSVNSVVETFQGPWTAPENGIIKVNFDAGVLTNGHAGSVAAVCRDSVETL